MHQVLRISLWVLGVIAVLLAGTFIYLRNADLSVYEEQIEGFLSNAIGQKVDVDGLFELHFGKLTSITAEEIRISNIGWKPDPVLATVGHFSVTVDLWSLITRPVIIEELEIRDVDVRLERNDDGQANWESAKASDDGEAKGEFDRELIAFREVRIDDVQLVFTDPARRRPLNVNIEHLSIEPDESHVLDLDLNGVINEIPIWADGKLGPWQNLLDGQDIIADLDVTLGQVRITVEGSVDNLPKLIGTELSLSVSGPAIDRVTDRLGLPPFAEGAFQVDARIRQLDEGSQFRLEGNVGAIDIFASGRADSLIDLDEAQLDFNFSGPDTRYVAEVFGIDGAPTVPFLVSGDVDKVGARFELSGMRAQLGENALRVDGWLDFKSSIPDGKLTVNASGPDFSVVGPFARIRGMPAEAFEVDARVQKTGANWQVDDLQAVVGDNRISANGALGGADSQINFSVTGPDISFLQEMTGLQGLPQRKFDVSARLKPDRTGIKLENATGIFGENRLDINGVVGTGRGLSGTNLVINGKGSELMNVSLLTGVPYLPEGPFEFGGRVRIDNHTLHLSEATVAAGGMVASALGTVALGTDIGNFDLMLSLKGPDLAALTEFEILDRMSGEAFVVEARVRHEDDELELDDVNAAVGNLELSAEIDLASTGTIADVSINASAPDSAIISKLTELDDLPNGTVQFSGRIEFMETEFEFTNVEARFGDYLFAANGTLSIAPLSNSSDLRFSTSGPELHQMGLPFGIDDLPDKPFSVSGEVNGTPTGFAVEKLIAKIGENNIDGRFTADLREKAEIKGYLSSSYIDLRRRMSSTEAESADADASTDEYLFSDDPLTLDWLEAANVDVEIKTGRLRLQQGDLQNFHIGMKIWDGTLEIDPVSFRGPGGGLTGHLRLAPSNDSYALEVSILANNVYLGIMASEDQDRATLPPLNGRFDLRSTGDSMHALMGSSNGKSSFTHGAGRARNMFGSRIFSDVFLQVVRAFNPMRKADEYTVVECGIYDVSIKDGVATIENLAIQSDKLTVVTRGNVNFENETLNLTIRAAPREGLGISIGGVANSFFKLGGTLRTPKLKIDPTASVATAGAAVATGGLSIVAKGLWDRVKAQTDICKDLEQE